jgi:hypothetical protein
MSMTLTEEILKKYPTSVFIETGTFNGDGILVAIKAGFNIIRSIEIFEGRADTARVRFHGFPQDIRIYAGKSKDLLGKVISEFSVPVTFWLDAHSDMKNDPEEGTAPVLDELAVIAQYPQKHHVILIDDMRLCGLGNWRYVSREKVIEAVMKINPYYEIEFIDSRYFAADILVAHVPETQRV